MESILKIYMSAVSGSPSCERSVSEFGSKATAALEGLREVKKGLSAIPDPHSNHGKILAILDLGIRTYGAWRQWASETGLRGSE